MSETSTSCMSHLFAALMMLICLVCVCMCVFWGGGGLFGVNHILHKQSICFFPSIIFTSQRLDTLTSIRKHPS